MEAQTPKRESDPEITNALHRTTQKQFLSLKTLTIIQLRFHTVEHIQFHAVAEEK